MMTNRISADNDTLLEHVPVTTDQFLDHAIGALDERYGVGYAKLNPNLVAAYLRACTDNFAAAILARAIEAIEDDIAKFVTAMTQIQNGDEEHDGD
jgi:hypothetical protein